jgi:hypothetical protein
MDASVKHYAIEAYPSRQNIIDLPNFHALFYRVEGAIMMGKCLDFGLRAYSQKNDDMEALDEAFRRLSEMVILHIVALARNGLLDTLYAEAPELAGEYGHFASAYNRTKLQRLKESMNRLAEEMDKSRDLSIESLVREASRPQSAPKDYRIQISKLVQRLMLQDRQNQKLATERERLSHQNRELSDDNIRLQWLLDQMYPDYASYEKDILKADQPIRRPA